MAFGGKEPVKRKLRINKKRWVNSKGLGEQLIMFLDTIYIKKEIQVL